MDPDLTLEHLIANVGDFSVETRTPFAALPWTEHSKVIWRSSETENPLSENGIFYASFLPPQTIETVLGFVDYEDVGEATKRVIKYAENTGF